MTNFDMSKAKFNELGKFISDSKDSPGSLMPVMQKAQDLFGYLPIEIQDFIAESMGIPMTDVYGVATFYSQFALEAKGKNVIGVCMGTACYVKSAQVILDKLSEELKVKVGKTTRNKKFTLEATRCLGCCGLAPVIMINDKVYGRLVPEDIVGILDNYKK